MRFCPTVALITEVSVFNVRNVRAYLNPLRYLSGTQTEIEFSRRSYGKFDGLLYARCETWCGDGDGVDGRAANSERCTNLWHWFVTVRTSPVALFLMTSFAAATAEPGLVQNLSG